VLWEEIWTRIGIGIGKGYSIPGYIHVLSVFVIFACATKKVSGCWQIDPSSLAYEGHGLYYFLGLPGWGMGNGDSGRIINVAAGAKETEAEAGARAARRATQKANSQRTCDRIMHACILDDNNAFLF